jgi:hypothetical protein
MPRETPEQDSVSVAVSTLLVYTVGDTRHSCHQCLVTQPCDEGLLTGTCLCSPAAKSCKPTAATTIVKCYSMKNAVDLSANPSQTRMYF